VAQTGREGPRPSPSTGARGRTQHREIPGVPDPVATPLLSQATANDDRAGDKIDAKQLVGKWMEQGEKTRFAVEFQEAGQVLIDTDGDESERGEGTYQLDGNTLELTIKRRTGDLQMVRTITKLTDEEFVSREEGKKEDTLYRVKRE
jgi:uncharacterized protein (TIGR03066 family)